MTPPLGQLSWHFPALLILIQVELMSNPYQSPSFDPKQFQDYPSQLPLSSGGFGWVSQIRIVAILNCVQGGLESLMGTFLAGLGIFFPS